MSGIGAGFLVLLGIALIPVFFFIVVYNGLVRLRNTVDESWSDVQTELQRRYNLIPNLVNTVKGYATHERSLLEEVTRLRQDCVNNTGSPASQAATESKLNAVLGGLMVRLEAYPDLKANQNFLELQRELSNTEDRIQAAYRFYNGNVREYNNRVQMFPSNIVAGMFGFALREFFEIQDEKVREVPPVAF
ncbi:MAG TPA: LemA family protein [Candidatus Hydrogenedentes bacterium]|nr:LemA family protein [Candidatus Hydrogenedentota bacterium]HOS01762.1 LemA family protein [Candidatus Hydrogenedentota bacterium]